MGVFSLVEKTGHEQILYGHDPKSGLRTIIAIHSTPSVPLSAGPVSIPTRTRMKPCRMCSGCPGA